MSAPMDNTVLIVIVGCFQAIAVAVIGGLFARDARTRKKQHDHTEARASLRAEEGRLMMRLLSTDMRLTMATAHAVKEGKANGTMDAALAAAEDAEAEYYNFINAVASKQIAK